MVCRSCMASEVDHHELCSLTNLEISIYSRDYCLAWLKSHKAKQLLKRYLRFAVASWLREWFLGVSSSARQYKDVFGSCLHLY